MNAAPERPDPHDRYACELEAARHVVCVAAPHADVGRVEGGNEGRRTQTFLSISRVRATSSRRLVPGRRAFENRDVSPRVNLPEKRIVAAAHGDSANLPRRPDFPLSSDA